MVGCSGDTVSATELDRLATKGAPKTPSLQRAALLAHLNVSNSHSHHVATTSKRRVHRNRKPRASHLYLRLSTL